MPAAAEMEAAAVVVAKTEAAAVECLGAEAAAEMEAAVAQAGADLSRSKVPLAGVVGRTRPTVLVSQAFREGRRMVPLTAVRRQVFQLVHKLR